MPLGRLLDSQAETKRQKIQLIKIELKLGLTYTQLANAAYQVGKLADAERSSYNAHKFYGAVLEQWPMLDKLNGLQNVLLRRKLRRLEQAVNQLSLVVHLARTAVSTVTSEKDCQPEGRLAYEG